MCLQQIDKIILTPKASPERKNGWFVIAFSVDIDNMKCDIREFDASPAKSLSQLLDTDIDAVYIASPVNLHLEHVLAVAKAKKKGFCLEQLI